MHKKSKDAAAAKEALKFFEWAYANGDKAAEELDYVPLPDSVVELIKKSWTGIVGDDAQGARFFREPLSCQREPSAASAGAAEDAFGSA